MPSGNAPFVANGNIPPSRIVKIDATADNRVILAGVGDLGIGVSQQGTRRAPYSTLNDGFCAIAGEELRVFQTGEIAPVEAGAAITRGVRVGSDATGRAILAGAAVASIGIANQSASGAGVLIEISVIPDSPGAT